MPATTASRSMSQFSAFGVNSPVSPIDWVSLSNAAVAGDRFQNGMPME